MPFRGGWLGKYWRECRDMEAVAAGRPAYAERENSGRRAPTGPTHCWEGKHLPKGAAGDRDGAALRCVDWRVLTRQGQAGRDLARPGGASQVAARGNKTNTHCTGPGDAGRGAAGRAVSAAPRMPQGAEKGLLGEHRRVFSFDRAARDEIVRTSGRWRTGGQ